MSTETPAPTPETPPTEPQGTEQPKAPAAPAQEIDWKAEARKWEARAKENKTAAERLAEIEKANLSEVERAKREAEEAKAEAAQYRQREQVAAWKAQVSQETGVPAAALAGSSLEEIQAHAETLKSLITPAQPAPPAGPTVPGEGGVPPTTAVAQLTKQDLESMTPKQINEARKAGRLNKLLGIN